LFRRAAVVALALLLGADSPVDLPLVVLAALMEHGQHHDRAIWSAPPELSPRIGRLQMQIVRKGNHAP
jgi:hypothetical protein